MNFAGKINVIGHIDAFDSEIRSFTIGLQSAFYYRYYYGYSLQTMVGDENSS
jgi:hypothetical protein